MPVKLDSRQIHFLKLIARDQNSEGWAPVSKPVYPLVQALPVELVELEPVGDEGRGRVRLTQAGQNLLDAMAWL